MTWVDVATRARGLGTHVLGDDLAGAARRAADELAILVRWADDRAGALAVFVADEDRRSLRALLRGLAAGASVERRLAATTPTPGLPAAALRELAGQPTPAGFAAVLARRGHPLAIPLDAPLDLLAAELALTRRFADRARRARGGAALASHVAQMIDAELAGAALLLAARGDGIDPAAAFAPGGARIDRPTFLAAARATPARARQLLADALAGTPLASAAHDPAPEAIEEAALAWQLATQRRLARLEPAGLAAVLALLLRRRLELRELRRGAWRAVLGGAA